MTEDTKSAYAFLANHLRDIRHLLEQQMRAKRKWEWIDTPQGAMAAELMPLLSVIMLLERLAQPEAQAFPPSGDVGTGLPEN